MKLFMDESIVLSMQEAIDKARVELSKAIYLSECGSNAGIRKINENKTAWLSWVVYLADRGIETIKDK